MIPISLKTTRTEKGEGKEESGGEKETGHTHNFNIADCLPT